MDGLIPGDQTIQPVPPVSEETAILVSIGQYLLVAGAIIDITTKNDSILIFSAFVKLTAIGLFITAAFRESNEQRTASGGITTANKLKVSGSIVTLASALLLTTALLIEAYVRRVTGVQQVTIPPAVGGTGAFSV